VEKRKTYRVLEGKAVKGGHWEDTGINEGTILKQTVQFRVGYCRLNSSGSAEGQAAGSCKHGNELVSSTH